MNTTKRILLVSHYLPTRGHAGGLRLLDLYSLIRRRFPGIEIVLAAHCNSDVDWNDSDIKDIFDRVFLFPKKKFTVAGLSQAGVFRLQFDVVDLQYWQSFRFLHAFRRMSSAKIIFSPMESMVRALYLDILHKGKGRDLRTIFRHAMLATLELYASWRADSTQCVSAPDASILRKLLPRADIHAVETGLSPLEFPRLYKQQNVPREIGETDTIRRVVFVAFFGSRTNVEALSWYMEEVHPHISATISGYRLVVVGRGSERLKLPLDDRIEIRGEVKSIEEPLLNAWVGICPALSGAGFRGKIVQYAAAAVPCVASALAADGLPFVDGESILIAQDAPSFIRHCMTLLSSSQRNKQIGIAAHRVCLAHHLWDNNIGAIEKIYQLQLESPSLGTGRKQ